MIHYHFGQPHKVLLCKICDFTCCEFPFALFCLRLTVNRPYGQRFKIQLMNEDLCIMTSSPPLNFEGIESIMGQQGLR